MQIKGVLREIAGRLLALAPERVRHALFRLASDAVPDPMKLHAGMCEMAMGLRLLHANGLAPDWIIDVGAYAGGWARMARGVFERARILMVEANPECAAALHAARSELGNCEATIALLGREPRSDVPFYAMATGSSVLPELTEVSRKVLSLPMSTLDALVPADASRVLLKLDVQGYELEILRGAPQTLERCVAVLLEVSLLPYNAGGPLLAEVVSFMHARHFVAYDVCASLRRKSDLAMCQADLVFVPEDSPLREQRPFF